VLDPWLTLPALSKVSGLSVCTLREFCNAKTSPLPYYRMKEPHVVIIRDGRHVAATGKILVRRSEFEWWMEQYHHIPARGSYTAALDVDRMVEGAVEAWHSEEPVGARTRGLRQAPRCG
jgi:hypothetical protein